MDETVLRRAVQQFELTTDQRTKARLNLRRLGVEVTDEIAASNVRPRGARS